MKENIFQRLFEYYSRLPSEDNLFEDTLMWSIVIPAFFLGMALTGFILIMRRNRWGYALSFVGALGIAVISFFFND